MCHVRGSLDLSYECLTSYETNERLISLSDENPKLWKDLQTKSTRDHCPDGEEEVAEDVEPYDDEGMGDDDSEIPHARGSSGEAEDADADFVPPESEELSGKRKRRPNAQYADFWRHVRGPGGAEIVV
ncbi:hypothetical protein R3P38DRAFT_2793684 [Favolaschia claudopus]|uniref:Uncharacterized protein n=1 Tax=Favolaschia claudopus TaxID=2862362 RepID=A0AAW0ACJ3_9AGAR